MTPSTPYVLAALVCSDAILPQVPEDPTCGLTLSFVEAMGKRGSAQGSCFTERSYKSPDDKVDVKSKMPTPYALGHWSTVPGKNTFLTFLETPDDATNTQNADIAQMASHGQESWKLVWTDVGFSEREYTSILHPCTNWAVPVLSLLSLATEPPASVDLAPDQFRKKLNTRSHPGYCRLWDSPNKGKGAYVRFVRCSHLVFTRHHSYRSVSQITSFFTSTVQVLYSSS